MDKSSCQPLSATDAKLTSAFLKRQTTLRPHLAIVLGSGFQQALVDFKLEREFPYSQLQGFPPVGVSGHAGKLLLGHLGSTPVVVLKGRAHFYEGHSMERITFPVRVLADFGVRAVLLTNAAGAINSRFRPGDFMVIEDHLNFMGTNPLRGVAAVGRNRFVDLTSTYDVDLRTMLQRAASKARIKIRKGVYIAVAGPSYETPAEIRAFSKLGADAVGMSTVPEAIVARQCGMRVAGLSCLTNMAARTGAAPVSHREVLAMVDHSREAISAMMLAFAGFFVGSEGR